MDAISILAVLLLLLLAAILIFGVRLAVYIATGRYAIDTRLDQLRRDG